jgi:hypothetical protein
VRTLNAPLLLVVGIIERRTLWAGARRQKEAEQFPKQQSRVNLWDLSRGFSVHGDIEAVFNAEPPQDIDSYFNLDDDPANAAAENEIVREFVLEAVPIRSRGGTNKSRRDSVAPFAGLNNQLRDILNQGNEEGVESGMEKRLTTLEQATSRIEVMLTILLNDRGLRNRNIGDREIGMS